MSAGALPRHVKGGRPAFHADPAIDRLIRMVLTLTSEISVLSERLATVEALAGIDPAAIDAFTPDAQATAQREKRREALIDRVLADLHEELDAVAAGEDRDRYWDTIRAIEEGEV
ncbi:MAG: hypothetical protein SNJ79_02465 [Sphingomonadaceae bacterium]